MAFSRMFSGMYFDLHHYLLLNPSFPLLPFFYPASLSWTTIAFMSSPSLLPFLPVVCVCVCLSHACMHACVRMCTCDTVSVW